MERRRFLKLLCSSVPAVCVVPTLIANDSITAGESEVSEGLYNYVKKHSKPITYQKLTQEKLEEIMLEVYIENRDSFSNDFVVWTSKAGMEEIKKAMRCYNKPWQLFAE